MGHVNGEREWDWRTAAACRGTDTDAFYHPDNERGPAREQRERAAKLICARCPVLIPCRRWALRTREPYGVWGGLSAAQREQSLAECRRPQADPSSPRHVTHDNARPVHAVRSRRVS
jgi:WhiB family redox-sensing transcriptional regulator